MAKVITLDGLRNGSLDDLKVSKLGRAKCEKTTSIYSPTLDREVEICQEDIARIAQKSGGMTKRRRGRPKGSTVKAGARKPDVKSCARTEIVRNKRGRKVCRCSDPGNTQILPHDQCGIPKKGK